MQNLHSPVPWRSLTPGIDPACCRPRSFPAAMPASLGAVSYLSASQQHRHARADDLRGGGSVMDGLVSESSFSNTPVNPSSPTAHLDEGAGDPFHFHAQQQQQQAQQLQQGMHPMAALAALQQQQQQQDIGALSSSSNIHAAEGLAMSPRVSAAESLGPHLRGLWVSDCGLS